MLNGESERPLATFERNLSEQVKVALCEYRGHWLLNLRVWFRDEVEDEWRPTRKGVTFRLGELPQLAEAVAGAIREAEALMD